MQKWMRAAGLAFGLMGTAAMAEPQAAPVPAAPLALERVFASPALNGPTPRAVRLSPDGQWVTSLRPRAEDRERFDLWALPTSGGDWRMLVDSTKLGTSGQLSEAQKMQLERARIAGTKGIITYDWAADSKALLVHVDGDLFLAGLDGSVTRLTQSGDTLDGTLSPKGGFVSFVRNNNVYVMDRSTGTETRLSKDGGGAISWGLAEFVAQEEMHRYQGMWWAPNDSALAVQRTDESGVAVISRAAIGADGTTIYNQRYPQAGAANAQVQLWVMDPKNGRQVRVDLGPDADIYLARVDWAADGSALYVQRETRDQKRLDMLRVDPKTGASQILFSETSKSWINLHDSFRALEDGSLIWQSERDGFAHLYRFAGGQWTQLTQGPWMVRKLVGVDAAKGLVYFLANKDTPLEQHLYSVPLAGGETTRLTALGMWHSATMARAGNRAIVEASSQSQPPQVWLADADGHRLAWIEENKLDARHAYAPYVASHVVPRFDTITAADGSVLHTKLLTPPLAPGKRYPVLVQVYNGPGAGRQVMNTWGGALQQYLVDQGWIIFSIDGRGSPDRGVAFESQIYRAMGGVEVADQLAGVAWLKSQPFVDPKKIAVYGWSYGGYMTAKLLEAAPGTFAAGVSGAPVTKWELYDTHYTERYMGTPQQEAAAYAKSGAIEDAAKIRDPLLLIHGMADDNVFFENTTALMAKLQHAAVPFETMVYPGQTHAVGGPKVSVHLWTTILNFLNRTVKNKD